MLDTASKDDDRLSSLDAPAITLEVAGASQMAIPLQELQPQKSRNSIEVLTGASADAMPVPTDLPPIDKRGFLTLLAQDVSRYAFARFETCWIRQADIKFRIVPGTLEAVNSLSIYS